MADAISSQSITMDELYIRDTIDLLIARKDEISIRFTVEIKIEKPTTACMDDGCWVSIVGSEEKVKTAKVGAGFSLEYFSVAAGQGHTKIMYVPVHVWFMAISRDHSS